MLLTPRLALICLHSAALLFSLAGLFSAFTALPAITITAARSGFAAIALTLSLYFVPRLKQKINPEHAVLLSGLGLLLALHWSSFFVAIELTSISIGLFTFACYPLFTSLLGLLFFHQAIRWQQLLQNSLIIVGVGLLVQQSGVNESQVNLLGIGAGLFSALSFALISLSNKNLVQQYNAFVIARWQNAVACIILLPWFIWQPVTINMQQLGLLVLLGTVFTAFAHSLFNLSLTQLSAQQASLAVSLEPVYGALAAFLLLGQQLSYAVLLGGSLIVLANIWSSVAKTTAS